MKIIQWAPITRRTAIPPFGAALEKHIMDYHSEARRESSLSAWWLLHQILTEHDLPCGEVVFDENGKPGFRDSPLFFSLSHSGSVCAAAVADVPVGVDVERRRARVNRRLIARVASAAELAAFDGDFTRIWCRKEAAAKLSGAGILWHPERIDIRDGSYDFTEERFTADGQTYDLVCAAQKQSI